eukprot:gene8099-8292_t
MQLISNCTGAQHPYCGASGSSAASDGYEHLARPVCDKQTLLDVRKLLGSLHAEYDYWVKEQWIEGSIPYDLQGTYFRNGPGLQVTNPLYSRHPFDGDGMVCRFSFRDGRMHFSNRFVRTKGFVQEQVKPCLAAASRTLNKAACVRGHLNYDPSYNAEYDGMTASLDRQAAAWTWGAGRQQQGSWQRDWHFERVWATDERLFNPFDMSMKNVANTGVLHWGNKLLALWENGLPYALDPRTLETLGETDLDGQIDTAAFGAHYRIMLEADGSRRWVTFAFTPGLFCTLSFKEFDEGGQLLGRQSYLMLGQQATIVHDFVVTPQYYVVIEGPVSLSSNKFVGEYIWGKCSMAECLVYDTQQQTKVHLIPRPGAAAKDTLAWNTIDFGHFNYDVMDDQLDTDYYKGGARTHLVRLVCDLQQGTTRLHRLARRTMEFPSVNWMLHGQPHRHLYTGGDGVDDEVHWAPLKEFCKVSLDPLAGVTGPIDPSRDVKLQSWLAGDRCFALEPLFVPRMQSGTYSRGSLSDNKGQHVGNRGSASSSCREDDGWVLATFYDAEKGRGGLVIFDAANFGDGPVARIWLPHHLPSGLHGSFSSECFAPDSSSETQLKPEESQGHERPTPIRVL